MSQLPEYVDGLPNVCGSEPLVEETLRASRANRFPAGKPVDFGHIRAACAIALHMHQPLDSRRWRRPGHGGHYQQSPVHDG
jgi:hypothetical protein